MSGAVRRLCVLLLLLPLGACTLEGEEQIWESSLPEGHVPLDALGRRHGRLMERMRRRGYGRQIGLARTFVLEERGSVFPLDLRTDSCSTFVALGGTGLRDLRLALYDAEGAEAASDGVLQEGGLVHVCPQADPQAEVEDFVRAPYYLTIEGREGGGAVAVAEFRSPAGAGEGFEGLFEGVLAPRVRFRELEEHFAQTRTAARARGLLPLGPPHLASVTEGSVMRVPLTLDANRCYVAIGKSGESVRDLDLYLFDSGGVEVSRDLDADAEPSIEICPEREGRYTFELRVFEGAGAVGLLVLSGADERSAESSGDPVDATLTERGSGSAEESGDPGSALGVLAAALESRGFSAPLFVSRDASISPGEVRAHELVIGPGCAVLAGAASHEGIDLDLYLADLNGREIDSDTAVHSHARVRACRAEPEVLRVAVKGYGRDGAYALALFRAPPRITNLSALRMEEVAAPFRLRGYLDRDSFETLLSSGERIERSLELAAGRCVAVTAAGGSGATDVDLFLRDEEGGLLASDSGSAPSAAAARCADRDETLRLEILMYRGSGRVTVQVLDAERAEVERIQEPSPPLETER